MARLQFKSGLIGVGCAAFDHSHEGNICRIFVSVVSAKSVDGSVAETRDVISGYRTPDTRPSGWAAQCKSMAAPRLRKRGVLYENMVISEAIDVCRRAASESGSDPETWAYYARALSRADRFKEARRWATKSADAGNAVGQWFLGAIYHFGYGVKKDYARARKLYNVSATQGYPIAQVNLGSLYGNGYGVKRNYAKAAGLYRLAADQGEPNAQHYLGELYERGEGVSKDYAAAALYRSATDQGVAKPPFDLGRMYARGLGVQRDEAEAIELFRLSAERGYEPAVARVNDPQGFTDNQ